MLSDDGLLTPEVGEWGREKYVRVWMYDQMFSTGMRNAWATRVYIDLFSGAGRARLRTSGAVVPGSPLLALQVPHRFDKYIFCEQDVNRMDALQERVSKEVPDADVSFVGGDSNENVASVIRAIPRGGGVLSFCFVDPFSLTIKFDTIRKLATGRLIDFMALLALPMDARRNEEIYFQGQSNKLDMFLGNGEWRARWTEARMRGERFMYFLATEYIRSMQSIGYGLTSPEKMHVVHYNANHLPLYYLAFFSNNQKGYFFWDQVLKHSTAQPSLGL
jgi:three-Cys-motif partner protein